MAKLNKMNWTAVTQRLKATRLLAQFISVINIMNDLYECHLM